MENKRARTASRRGVEQGRGGRREREFVNLCERAAGRPGRQARLTERRRERERERETEEAKIESVAVLARSFALSTPL